MITEESEKTATQYLVDAILDFIIASDNHMGLFHIIEERIRVGGNRTKETAKETLRYLLATYMERHHIAQNISEIINKKEEK